MTVDGVLLIALGIFFVMAILEVPIGISLVASGALGVIMLKGSVIATSVIAAVPFSSTSRYSLFTIPAFVLLGAVVSHSGIARQTFQVVSRLTARVPNGIAVTTVGATALMSGISGSSAADVASMGRMCVREMHRVGYSLSRAAAVVAAAGAFAALIPPSIGLVLYGIVAEVSIGDMLLAGIIPGLLSAGALMVYLVIQGKVQGVGEEQETDVGIDARPTKNGNRRYELSALLIGVVIFSVVLGGLYTGVLTATESAGAGAVAAIVLVGILPLGTGTSYPTILKNAFNETVSTSAMIFLLVIGGAMVTYLAAAASLPERIAGAILELPVPPKMVLAVFLFVLIFLGMILDGLSILLLTVPIVAPVVIELGFDPVWFGILFMKLVEIGLITPPVGINVFVVAGLFKGLKVESVFRDVLPFVLLDLLLVAILFLVPDIILWLPNAAG